MALPKWLFVMEKKDNDGSRWLSCDRDQGTGVEDDGTIQVVGTYKLIKKQRMRKEARLILGKTK
jgi:hypothetical protein